MKYLLPFLITSLAILSPLSAAAEKFYRGEMARALMLEGLGLPQEAYEVYVEQARKGDTEALRRVGQLLYKGKGVSKDLKKSIMWTERAAKLGNPVAQFEMGLFYHRGVGVKQSYDEAILWYSRSAYAGNKTAPKMLGIMYSKGYATKKNYEVAHMWFEIYKKLGGKDTDKLMGTIRPGLNDAQIKKARAKAAAWSRK